MYSRNLYVRASGSSNGSVNRLRTNAEVTAANPDDLDGCTDYAGRDAAVSGHVYLVRSAGTGGAGQFRIADAAVLDNDVDVCESDPPPTGRLARPNGNSHLVFNRCAREAYSETVLADSPLAYYRFEELTGAPSATDSSGNNNHGTYVGTVTLEQPSASVSKGSSVLVAAGRSDQGVFNGFTVPSMQSSGATDFTVEFWLKPNDVTNLAAFGVAILRLENNHIYVEIRSTGVLHMTVVSGRTQIATGLTAGVWQHVVITYDVAAPSNNVKTYINGTLAQTSTEGPTLFSGFADTLTVGHTSAAALSKCLNGYLDELAIYDYILPEARITAHYNA